MEALDGRFKKMEELLAELGSAGAGNAPGVIASFLSGGLFFLLLGGGLIFMAQAYMSTNHAGTTFVWVVLGVALMLYGTGTQGMGQFNSGAGYNVAMAGGAGVVAFAVPFGIIGYSGKMRDAFQPERKFVRVLIQGGDGVTVSVSSHGRPAAGSRKCEPGSSDSRYRRRCSGKSARPDAAECVKYLAAYPPNEQMKALIKY